jgi:hypothetical protein
VFGTATSTIQVIGTPYKKTSFGHIVCASSACHACDEQFSFTGHGSKQQRRNEDS